MPIADVELVMMASAADLAAQHFPREVDDWEGLPLGCIFLQESSGFLCFPFLWHFFHRNHDSCSAVLTFFYLLRNPVCTGPTYVAVGSYVGLEKEQSLPPL